VTIPYYLPPDFNVELLLDDLFPERVVKRFRATEGAELGDVCERCLVQSPCQCPTGAAR
jgi:hypothetical protein